jgi:hypothetical protein
VANFFFGILQEMARRGSYSRDRVSLGDLNGPRRYCHGRDRIPGDRVRAVGMLLLVSVRAAKVPGLRPVNLWLRRNTNRSPLDALPLPAVWETVRCASQAALVSHCQPFYSTPRYYACCRTSS